MRERLKTAPYDDIAARGQGRVDELIGFLFGSGLFGLIESLPSLMRRAVDIPRPFINYCVALRPVLGISGISQIGERLFTDPSIIRALGFSLIEIEEGFSPGKNKKKENVPCNLDAFYDELSRLTPGTWRRLLSGQIMLFARHNFLSDKDGVFAMDGTELEVKGKSFERSGVIAKKEQILKAGGQVVTRVTKKRGYKLVTLLKVTKKQTYVVAASIIPIHRSEIKVARQLIDAALSSLPKKTLRLLLVDRGFMDGKFFSFLIERGVDFIIPTKDNMQIATDMRGLAKLKGVGIKAVAQDGAHLVGMSSLRTLSTCSNALRGVLVTRTRDGKELAAQERFGFITSLPASTEKQVLRVYESYRRRWTIETKCFEELKRAWYIGRFPGRSFRAVYAHVMLTLFMFNAVNAFMTRTGEDLAVEGLISLRHRFLKPHDDVVVYHGDAVGIFVFQEILEACGLPPPGKLKHDRIEIIWPGDPRYPKV